MGTREAKLLIHLLRACLSWRVFIFLNFLFYYYFFNDLVTIREGTANDHNLHTCYPEGGSWATPRLEKQKEATFPGDTEGRWGGSTACVLPHRVTCTKVCCWRLGFWFFWNLGRKTCFLWKLRPRQCQKSVDKQVSPLLSTLKRVHQCHSTQGASRAQTIFVLIFNISLTFICKVLSFLVFLGLKGEKRFQVVSHKSTSEIPNFCTSWIYYKRFFQLNVAYFSLAH